MQSSLDIAARLAGFRREIGDIPLTDDLQTRKAMSRDWSSVSPLLRKSLRGRIADAVATPRDRSDIETLIRAAVRTRMPLIARGGGTANYGQSVPLAGGVTIDFRNFAGLVASDRTRMRALAGTNTDTLDAELRAKGMELRIHPSTRHVSTLAGFIAGGSGGIGSIRWGLLRDRGNISAIKLLSIEETPREVELRGKDVLLAHHAYGTNGLIVEIEMPLEPAWEWRELVFAFPDFKSALDAGIRLGHEDALLLKVLSLQEWPIARLMPALGAAVPDGHTMLSTMTAAQHRDEVVELAVEYGGTLVHDHAEGQGPYNEPLYRFCYGHSLMQVQKKDMKYTSVQTMFGGDDLRGQLMGLHPEFAGTMPFRLEFQKSQGKLVAVGSPLFLYECEAHMADIVRRVQASGALVANSHTTSIRNVGMKTLTQADLDFTRKMDPHGLLNPGKVDLADDALDTALGVSGWHFEEAETR
jgi:FAD/FMN-containing dehydrogenase